MRASKRAFAWLGAAVAVGMATAGCGSLDPSESGPPQDGRTYYSRTVVRLKADGTIEERTDWITPEQQEAQKAARAGGVRAQWEDAAELMVDSGCAAASLWMFDQQNIQGAMLCLAGTGTLDLSHVPRGIVCDYIMGICFPRILLWQNNVRSVWTGSQVALLGRRDANAPEHVAASSAARFDPWIRYDVVFALMADAVELLP